ncbi:MAG TPA: alpha/beta fold hydrolase [Gemmatimonadaceae bacterium]|nr:alpha/beta fold hydrolase [Gemmatimonadaceae bacterium]
MQRTRHLAAAIVLALAATPLRAAMAQAQQPDDATFYLIVGSDTLFAEHRVRTPSHVEGELLVRAANRRVRFDAALSPDALMRELRVYAAASPGDSMQLRQTLRFSGDSVRSTVANDSATVAAPHGALPYINPSPTFMEQMALRLRALHADSANIPLFAPESTPVTVSVRRLPHDSVLVSLSGVELRLALAQDGTLLGGTVPAQRLRIVRAPAGSPLSSAPKDYSAPAAAPYTAQDVTITTPAGVTLAGTLTMPKAHTGRVPAVVTITGSGQQDRDEAIPGIDGYRPFRQIADTLGRRGIAVLRLDDRGIGGSGGDPTTETSADYANDVQGAVAWLRARPDIDPARIALLGHSEGGYVAPMVASTDSTIAAIVLLAGPSRTGRRVIAYQLERQIERANADSATRDSLRRALPARMDSMGTNPWMRYFYAHDPAATARTVHVPVLILQGGHDVQVTPDQAPELAAAFRAGGNTHVTMHVFPTLNHLFLEDPQGETEYAALPSKTVPPVVLGMIADWLVATLHVGG